jgi:hypothetical protein
MRKCRGVGDIIKMTVFWNFAPCRLIEIDQRFKCAFCLHHQGVSRQSARVLGRHLVIFRIFSLGYFKFFKQIHSEI